MFFEQLKKACMMRNTSVTAVALKLNISKSNVTNWKKGTMPNCDIVIRLSELLCVSTDFLLKGIDEQNIFNNTITNNNNVEVNTVKHGDTYNSASFNSDDEMIRELITVFSKLSYRERVKLMGIIYDFEEECNNSNIKK